MNRLPSVANSGRLEGRAGSSKRTSSPGAPPAAGIDQTLDDPAASNAL
jgi:hypothetical protein